MQRIFHGAVYALLAAYSPVWQLPKYKTPYRLDTYCTIWCELSLGVWYTPYDGPSLANQMAGS